MSDAHPCRLTVYLAREAPVGVVLRRGPSDWVRLSVWRTDRDSFAHGQWLRARVYERRADLSADGSLFVYFAAKRGGVPSEQGGDRRADSWIAVSRPPFFTALALWWVGGTYCAGGLFPERGALWTGYGDGPPDEGKLPEWLRLGGAPPYRDRSNEWTDRTVFFSRLTRDGWHRLEESRPETWQRTRPGGGPSLLMADLGYDARVYGGPHVTLHALRLDGGEEPLILDGVTWADWEQSGRLVLARDGRLLLWESPASVRVLEDFNGQAPEPGPSPAWARRWPPPPP